MRVRQKLFAAMATLVVITSVAFFTLSHGYLSGLFRQYAQAAREGDAETWASYLEYYYQANGDSWIGVDSFIHQLGHGNTGQVSSLILYDARGQVVAQIGAAGPDASNPAPGTSAPSTGLVEAPIVVNGTKVGDLQIHDRGIEALTRIERTVLRSALLATVSGTLVTGLLALFIGAWFSRWITSPMQRVIQGLRRIAAGDLDTKVSVTSKDEFGEVADAFNDMTSKLARTEQARRHLVADVAHELRMPLTVMQGQLELIQQGLKPAVPETLLPIQDEIFRLTRLVQDLHQLSLAEVGKLSLVKTTVQAGQLLARIVDNFEIEFEDKGIAFSFTNNIAPEDTITVDPDRITQVFVNLLGNALRYTPAEGRVKVTVDRDGADLRVSIEDTGPGIPGPHLTHIFDRFYRADEDRSRETGGTGLGLAIAKEFVEAHNGRIDVSSTVGQGTKFTVWIPLDKPAIPSIQTVQDVNAHGEPG
ncbi:HAMP domain-containing protein [Alicyclobacillus curvatus]|jgi:two-component system, OmpR family, sensor histidine kinase BaeS|nr:HAMP domain-containing protein [Alicyclobacillus curvatus]